jgi:Flp pilus assembly CpaE family ATPase|tara:strand:- start:681 stop:1316 length:636 start_codon:yes stop_codon:yes gene_type:complete
MIDLTPEMIEFAERLEPIARPGGNGRVLMFMGAGRGTGASTLARDFARIAAARSRRGVWLFDLDSEKNPQHKALSAQSGQVFDAGFGRDPYWRVEPETARARMVARRCADKLYVTEFQRAPGEVKRLTLRRAESYWAAVRRSIDMAIVDAPGMNKAVLAMVADMDGVILVADERRPSEDAIEARRAAIEARGGIVAGVILNRGPDPARWAA